MSKEKVLEVKDLSVSFRTPNGLVRAVREVTFDLYKGETLAIVGESGSGKSVTNRAIMGILARNAIIDGGEINYKNQDLTKLSEANFHKIRGNKIGMIFQDPLSSLNPTMKIGKQITEAMLVNGNRIKNKELEIYHHEYHEYLNLLAEIKILKKEIEDFSYEVSVNPELSKAEKKEKIAEIKDTHNKKIKELQALVPERKKAFLDKKKEAKQVVKEEFDLLRVKRNETLGNLNAELKELKAAPDNPDDLQKVKDAVEAKQQELAETTKKYNEQIEMIKAEIPEIKAKSAAEVKEVEASVKVEIEKLKEEVPSNDEEKRRNAEKIRMLSSRVMGMKKKLGDSLREVRRRLNATKFEAKEEISRLKAELKDVALSPNQKLVLAKKAEIAEVQEQFDRKFKVTKKEAYERAIEIMTEVGIPEATKRFNQYPFQFSGGMRQRIVIATALTANPELLICDEPTTALDVTIQGQILNLIKELKRERDLSVIFITHDLGVVANIADRVAVMYAGKVVEYGTSEEIFYDPKHPYTWALLSSVPDLDTTDRLLSIPGTPPDMLFPPKGDAFADRNQYAMKIDQLEQPPYFKISDTHYAATWLLHPDAPKVEMPKIIQDRVTKYKRQVGAEKGEQ